MKEAANAAPSEPAQVSQIRRAERGIVAGYIHALSERHGAMHGEPAELDSATETGEGD